MAPAHPALGPPPAGTTSVHLSGCSHHVHAHTCGCGEPSQQLEEDAGCAGSGPGPCSLRGEGTRSGPCLPRRRSRVSTSHLSDRYRAESSRMNLAGNRAEKGPELLQAAAAREPAGAGHPRQVPSPQDTSTGPSLASVFLSVQWGKCCRKPGFMVLQVLPAPPPHSGLTAAQ